MNPRSLFIPFFAAALVLAGAFAFLTAEPEQAQKQAPSAKTAPPPRAEPPERDEGLPVLLNLATPEKCLIVDPGVYDGQQSHEVGRGRVTGVFIYNACKEPPVLSDVKLSGTHLSYAASRLPLKVALRAPHDPASRGKDKIISFERGGQKCNALETPAEACRFIAIPFRHVLIVPVAEKMYFSVRLKDGRRIEGYLAPPGSGLPRKGPPLKGMDGN